ncbi:MAG TPA: hypothetical protein EYG03_27075 [Planctomycetes bacterium]|nr:hypothetical protein [Fuerstiella sp.]HIK95626.1 hypothetical protein [Planctomycetota bacterium]
MNRFTIPLATLCLVAPAFADDSADAIRALQSVGEHATGAAEARTALQTLKQGGAANLLPVLKAFNGSSKLAANWLRSTFEAIADTEQKAGRGLPKGDLLAFVKDTSESPSARRLAFEWLLKRSPQLEDELIPGMLLDPSPDFRRDAVKRLIDQAAAANADAAVALYAKAMTGAVHEDQVKTIAKALKDAGEEVNISRHFGFLTKWKIIGPFDNKDQKGFPVVYPPETKLDLTAEYDGQLGKVKWESIATDDDYGVLDIGKQIENYKGSLMYTTTTWQSEKDQAVEIRLGTPNAWKLWVNGALMFEREEYHRGTRLDQYKVPVSLKAGQNTILVKICQNEQEQDWAQDYQFQLRVCDRTGAAVLPVTQAAANNTPRKEIR